MSENGFKHNYLNIHALISHSASAMNRDNNNLQKIMTLGGVKRARISSQSLKYAMRNSGYYAKHLGKPSDRTREILELTSKYVEELSEFPSEVVTKTISLLVGKDLAELAKELEVGKTSGNAIIPWSVSEVRAICKEISQAEKEGLTERQLAKRLKDNSENLHKALASTVDIALSGRMTTSGLIEPIDGAMALAHSFTTHHHETQLDWFTAVDTFSSSSNNGKPTAGHIGTQDFSAGTFYRYCSLNLQQLRKNIGGDKEKALEIAGHLVYLLAATVPGGKQHSFAAFNYAEYILCSFSDQPVSLADAFEKPVVMDRQGGFMQPSIKALQNHSKLLHEGYEIEHLQKELLLIELDEQLETIEITEKGEKAEKGKKKEKPKTTNKEEKQTIGTLREWVKKEGN